MIARDIGYSLGDVKTKPDICTNVGNCIDFVLYYMCHTLMDCDLWETQGLE